MSIEEDIREAAEKSTFNKNLPEFIDMAKYLEERLEKGEKLIVKVDEFELNGSHIADFIHYLESLTTEGKTRTPIVLLSGSHHIADFIYLELHKPKGKTRTPIILNCLGDIIYRADLFQDYKPLSQK